MPIQLPDVAIAHAPAGEGAASRVRRESRDLGGASVQAPCSIGPLHGDGRVGEVDLDNDRGADQRGYGWLR